MFIFQQTLFDGNYPYLLRDITWCDLLECALTNQKTWYRVLWQTVPASYTLPLQTVQNSSLRNAHLSGKTHTKWQPFSLEMTSEIHFSWVLSSIKLLVSHPQISNICLFLILTLTLLSLFREIACIGPTCSIQRVKRIFICNSCQHIL